ncbi:MAG: hypothetical protein ACREO5_03560 [Candidatus Binatia bacterium]
MVVNRDQMNVTDKTSLVSAKAFFLLAAFVDINISKGSSVYY